MGKCMLIRAECPRTGNPAEKRYCPAWTGGVVWKNDATGEEKIVNCAFQALMPGMVQVISASNRPAKAVEEVRNEIATGFTRLSAVMTAGISAALEEPPSTPQLEDHNGHK